MRHYPFPVPTLAYPLYIGCSLFGLTLFLTLLIGMASGPQRSTSQTSDTSIVTKSNQAASTPVTITLGDDFEAPMLTKDHIGTNIPNNYDFFRPENPNPKAAATIEAVVDDVAVALQELNFQRLRWPQGAEAQVYHWNEAVGSYNFDDRNESCGQAFDCQPPHDECDCFPPTPSGTRPKSNFRGIWKCRKTHQHFGTNELLDLLDQMDLEDEEGYTRFNLVFNYGRELRYDFPTTDAGVLEYRASSNGKLVDDHILLATSWVEYLMGTAGSDANGDGVDQAAIRDDLGRSAIKFRYAEVGNEVFFPGFDKRTCENPNNGHTCATDYAEFVVDLRLALDAMAAGCPPCADLKLGVVVYEADYPGSDGQAPVQEGCNERDWNEVVFTYVKDPGTGPVSFKESVGFIVKHVYQPKCDTVIVDGEVANTGQIMRHAMANAAIFRNKFVPALQAEWEAYGPSVTFPPLGMTEVNVKPGARYREAGAFNASYLVEFARMRDQINMVNHFTAFDEPNTANKDPLRGFGAWEWPGGTPRDAKNTRHHALAFQLAADFFFLNGQDAAPHWRNHALSPKSFEEIDYSCPERRIPKPFRARIETLGVIVADYDGGNRLKLYAVNRSLTEAQTLRIVGAQGETYHITKSTLLDPSPRLQDGRNISIGGAAPSFELPPMGVVVIEAELASAN